MNNNNNKHHKTKTSRFTSCPALALLSLDFSYDTITGMGLWVALVPFVFALVAALCLSEPSGPVPPEKQILTWCLLCWKMLSRQREILANRSDLVVSWEISSSSQGFTPTPSPRHPWVAQDLSQAWHPVALTQAMSHLSPTAAEWKEWVKLGLQGETCDCSDFLCSVIATHSCWLNSVHLQACWVSEDCRKVAREGELHHRPFLSQLLWRPLRKIMVLWRAPHLVFATFLLGPHLVSGGKEGRRERGDERSLSPPIRTLALLEQGTSSGPYLARVGHSEIRVSSCEFEVKQCLVNYLCVLTPLLNCQSPLRGCP